MRSAVAAVVSFGSWVSDPLAETRACCPYQTGGYPARLCSPAGTAKGRGLCLVEENFNREYFHGP